MSRVKHYLSSSKMSDLISDNYSMLLLIFRFEIALGVGDKTIREMCDEYGVDVDTFLYIVHFILNKEGIGSKRLHKDLYIPHVIKYLKNSHRYFLDFRLPAIRANLMNAISACPKDIVIVIQRFFDEYVEEVRKHMQYENKTVFPYAENLLEGVKDPKYSIEIFKRRHDQIELKIMELKNILIKYYTSPISYQLNSVLYDLFSCESELKDHNNVEDMLFIPAILEIEKTFA